MHDGLHLENLKSLRLEEFLFDNRCKQTLLCKLDELATREPAGQ